MKVSPWEVYVFMSCFVRCLRTTGGLLKSNVRFLFCRNIMCFTQKYFVLPGSCKG